MGRYLFRLPDVGEGVAEAEIVVWHVAVGDIVHEDQSLVDVMTDKATVDMTSPVAGTVAKVHGEIGAMIAVGSTLVELEVAGDGNAVVNAEVTADRSANPPEPAPQAPLPVPEVERPVPVAQPAARGPRLSPGAAPISAPATRRRAHDLGIPLQFVSGTGPRGRITPGDIDDYLASGTAPTQGDARYGANQEIADTRIVGLRRKIAEKMQESKRRIPHIAYVEECDVTELEALRGTLNANRSEGQPKLTLLPFFMLAIVRAVPGFPQVNARYDDEAGVLHSFGGVHIGIATQTPGGLMVPVVRHAETHDIWGLATELARVSKAARDGFATRDELLGSTITLTSLGTLGGVVSTPVINAPEVAIINPNKIVERPTVQGSFVTVRKMMNLSSSFDHRIVDGYDAASFIQQIKRSIEHPALLFMD